MYSINQEKAFHKTHTNGVRIPIIEELLVEIVKSRKHELQIDTLVLVTVTSDTSILYSLVTETN